MDYSNFQINRKQAQQICFVIIADIETYIDENPEKYEQFLTTEQINEA